MKLISILRKGLASVTLAALALSIVPFVGVSAASVSSFTDANQIPSWADEAIEELMDQGVISGNGDGSFAPNRQLNRAEVAKVIVLATGVDMDTSGGNAFPDVTAGDWFYDYVMTMYNYGWINGYPDGYFRPGVGINRVELAKMVVEAFELDTDTTGGPHFSDVDGDSWMYPYVETAFNNGLMTGFASGKFGAELAVTRAETAKITYDAQLVVAGPVGPAEGTLEVLLSYDTPRGTNIPYNATSVPFTTIEMTAADDSDVEISSITVTRLGLGDNDDFDNVWLEIDGFKVGNERAINNDDYAELRFNPPIVVPAGQTLVADVVGSLEGNSNSVGQHNRIAVVSAADVVSTAVNVVGDFPIEGEEMEIADYQVSQIEFDVLGSDTTVSVGDAFVEIGKFKLLNETTTNKDIELRAITFKNDGTAQLADVLENVVLYVSGEQVSAETIIDGDYITFRLDNGVTGGYIIEDGDSRIFSVRSDIVSAESGDVVNLKVDNFEDIVGVEVGTAFGVKAVSGLQNSITFSDSSTATGTADCSSSAAEDNCARLRAYTLDSGDVNITRDPASLGKQEYAPGSNDVVFMTARIVVDQPLTADGIKFRLATDTSVAHPTDSAQDNTVAAFEDSFDNFRLYLNDQLIDSKNELTASTALVGSYFDFDTQFEIAGTSIFKLVGNVKDDAQNGAQVKFALVASTDIDSPEYISTGDQVESDQLLGSAESSFVEVQESNITITRTDGLFTGALATPGETFVAGVDDLTVFKFVLDNNDSGDVNVTSITVQADGTGNASTYGNFEAAIFSDGVQQGSAKEFDPTAVGAATLGEATFNDLSVNIPSNGQKEFTVVLNTNNASAASAAATTTVVGNGTTATEDYSNYTELAVAAVPGDTTITVDDASNYAVGDALIIFTDGAAADSDFAAPDGDVLVERVAIKAISGNVITIGNTADYTQQDSIGVSHAVDQSVMKVTYVYDATPTVKVADTSGFTAGDTVNIDGTTFEILVVDTANSELDLDANVTAIAVDEAVTQTNTDSTIQFKVSAIDVDNVENGQTVAIENLADADAECKNELATIGTSLCSAVFGAVSTGTLTVSTRQFSPESQILVAGQEDVAVLEMTLTAVNDDIEIEELVFVNDGYSTVGTAYGSGDSVVDAEDKEIAQRVKFSLYDETGDLIHSSLADVQMESNGKLEFSMPTQGKLIVPKDDSTFVTVKVDVNDQINKSGQTGKFLNLKLDSFDATTDTDNKYGIKALTAATGTNITATAAYGTATGKQFVAYRTKIEFANSANQPEFIANTAGVEREFYRFSATADSAYDATLAKMTFNLIPSSATVHAVDGNTPAKYFLYECGSDASCGGLTASDKLADNVASGTAAIAEFDLGTDYELPAGETRYFELRTNVAIAQDQDDDYLKAEILEDSTFLGTQATRATAVGNAFDGTTEANIVWSDKSASGSSGPYLSGYQLVVPDADGASE